MFWKKKQKATATVSADQAAAPAGVIPPVTKTEVPKPKAKKLSSREIIISEIEQLGAGQSLRYRLRELWGEEVLDESVVIELNPQYPGKGQSKYAFSSEQLVDGKPAGKRTLLAQSNKPEYLAAWITERKGELMGVEEEAISS